MTPTRSCLVTGSRGFIGRHVVRALHARGWRVRCLTRQPRVDFGLERIDVIQGDLTSAAALRRAVADVECVFHLAGEKRDPAMFTAVNVDGTRALLEACAHQGTRAFVHLSSVGVTGPSLDGVVHEETPCHPAPGYEQSKWAAESEVRSFHAATQVPTVILRPANVFGDGDPERHLLSMMRTIAQGRFRLIGRRPAWLNYVYVGDVADACAIGAESPSGCQTYQLSDPCTLKAFAAEIASELSAPAIRPIPVPVGFTLGAIGSAISAVSGRPFPVTLDKIRASRSQTRYDPGKFQSAFPDWPFTGWQAGVRRTIAAYRSDGLV